MAIYSDLLPKKIFLEDYKGNYTHFIDAVYEVFERDFIKHRPVFGGFKLGLKYHPAFQERAYTFYHMTHKGDIESERTPDLRRCECISWGRPTIENVSEYSLKFWEQRRKSKRRICIWLETEDDVDYFFVLEIRKTFILPWTAFVAEYKHETIKKEREYQEWLASLNGVTYTPYELVGKMMSEMP